MICILFAHVLVDAHFSLRAGVIATYGWITRLFLLVHPAVRSLYIQMSYTETLILLQGR